MSDVHAPPGVTATPGMDSEAEGEAEAEAARAEAAEVGDGLEEENAQVELERGATGIR